MTQTKRLSRKELRAPDEFQTLSMRALDWARANSRIVWIGAGSSLALLILLAAVLGILRSREQRAVEEFYGASELFKREQWSEAVRSFAAIADDLGSTTYGRLSRLYAARAAARAGETDRSIEFYRAYLASPAGGEAVEQLARLDLAAALQTKGDLQAARSEVERALDLGGPARPLARLRLASLEEATGNSARAIELYRQYLDEDPSGADAELARARLIALGEVPPAPMAPINPGALQLQ